MIKNNGKGVFEPTKNISKIEFNVVLIRMLIDSCLPEISQTPWYKKYDEVSKKLGIVKYNSENTPTTKSNSVIMLYKAYR